MSRLRTILFVGAGSIGLTLLFWWPIWNGGGFIGGDVYTYYFPQKVIYAEGLRQGEIPLWNSKTGHGYPLVAESQTGTFYPFHLLLYSQLDVNTAYNVNHLFHYVLAFVFTWLYARSCGLAGLAAGFTALAFTYAWFPPRTCWEWAIIGGTWLPAALWCVERFLRTRHWRFAIALCFVLAVQMLAGHYNLAFVTQLILVAYVPLRLWVAPRDDDSVPTSRRGAALVLLMAALGCSFALAAAQLLPTWELKGLSQRAAAGTDHPLAFGSIPKWYWSQAVAPWTWYSPTVNRDGLLREASTELGALTNQVEAHLYFGLVPLAAAVYGFVVAIWRRERLWWIWFAIGLSTLIYTSGVFVPILQYLPGFNFFQGPGRFGIATTLAIALLAGRGFHELFSVRSAAALLASGGVLAVAASCLFVLASETQDTYLAVGATSPLTLAGVSLSGGHMIGLAVVAVLCTIASLYWSASANRSRRLPQHAGCQPAVSPLFICAVVVSVVDLWIVSRLVTYSPMIDDAPMAHIEQSPLRQHLKPLEASARLSAPGANLSSTLGVPATPVYLTFGPAVYVDPELKMPESDVATTLAWMNKSGVTHLLRFEPLDERQWPVDLVWRGRDPYLSRALALSEPVSLYKLRDSRGRAYFADQSSDAVVDVIESSAGRVIVNARSSSGGRLVLTELMYPGWSATVDGEPAEMVTFEKMFRAVDLSPGEHTVVYRFRPNSVYRGAFIGGLMLLLLATIAHIRYWHPKRLRLLDDDSV